ncbi:MAG: hypothetical protein GF341_08565 [candidate division Zixibacteria bacterium]|nr:hypothetical protein [candidate division Zixibacteria bacterium]
MTWFRRKGGADGTTERDPRIEMARQKNQQGDQRKSQSNGPNRSDQPTIVDSEFCYGGDAGPCA